MIFCSIFKLKLTVHSFLFRSTFHFIILHQPQIPSSPSSILTCIRPCHRPHQPPPITTLQVCHLAMSSCFPSSPADKTTPQMRKPWFFEYNYWNCAILTIAFFALSTENYLITVIFENFYFLCQTTCLNLYNQVKLQSVQHPCFRVHWKKKVLHFSSSSSPPFLHLLYPSAFHFHGGSSTSTPRLNHSRRSPVRRHCRNTTTRTTVQYSTESVSTYHQSKSSWHVIDNFGMYIPNITFTQVASTPMHKIAISWNFNISLMVRNTGSALNIKQKVSSAKKARNAALLKVLYVDHLQCYELCFVFTCRKEITI